MKQWVQESRFIVVVVVYAITTHKCNLNQLQMYYVTIVYPPRASGYTKRWAPNFVLKLAPAYPKVIGYKETKLRLSLWWLCCAVHIFKVAVKRKL